MRSFIVASLVILTLGSPIPPVEPSVVHILPITSTMPGLPDLHPSAAQLVARQWESAPAESGVVPTPASAESVVPLWTQPAWMPSPVPLSPTIATQSAPSPSSSSTWVETHHGYPNETRNRIIIASSAFGVVFLLAIISFCTVPLYRRRYHRKQQAKDDAAKDIELASVTDDISVTAHTRNASREFPAQRSAFGQSSQLPHAAIHVPAPIYAANQKAYPSRSASNTSKVPSIMVQHPPEPSKTSQSATISAWRSKCPPFDASAAQAGLRVPLPSHRSGRTSLPHVSGPFPPQENHWPSQEVPQTITWSRGRGYEPTG